MSIRTVSLILFNIAASIGSRIFSFACAFYILQHTDNTMCYTIYLTAIVIATLVTTPLLSIFADRYHNKLMVIIALLLNVIFLFIFTIAFDMFFNYIVILGIILNMTDVAIRAFIDANVNQIVKEDLERYLSLSQTINTTIQFLAPIIGGIMIAFFNIETLALLNLVTAGLGILFVLNLPLDKALALESTSIKESLREGYHYLKSKKPLHHFFIMMMVLHFLITVFSIGMPIAAVQLIQLSAVQFGIVVSGYTVGMLAASFLLTMEPEKDHLKSTYQRAMLLQCVTILILGIIVSFEMNAIVATLFFFILNGLMGLSQPMTTMPTSIYLQRAVGKQYQGHVMTLKQTLVHISSPVALLFFGLVLNHHQAVVYLMVALMILGVCIYLSRMVKKGFRFE
ncbi:MFS transporter [Staphylococcus intermedius]|uniref:Permease n=1 Tax=Staphylococcus intermedius NCTC 11048 TaxID=1141106 RepID=A0A380G5L3_STAIN|nr:MFS transporter [Staphylococcus intermedius]PCF64139.1 MFS transporter [Staphylococcus intermedius]PCF78854.1 MFS transporter [Staphylococcus intermedius]PCF79827.1 MFS transporter [Staphylococcus intermedius]PCF84992.1 MFS transporter [Staphylococcus intermedius]PCF89514.1 MFS transporter [Staphylococcus intermedius]